MKLPLKVKLKARQLIGNHFHEGIKKVVIKPQISFITAKKEGKYSLTLYLKDYEAWYLIGPKGGLRLRECLPKI